LKTIILFRHGRTDWNAEYSIDHDRPLSSKGILEVQQMGLMLSSIKSQPALVISSTAIRTKCTSEIAIKTGKWKSTMILESGIYGGNPTFLLNLIKKQNNNHNSICLVGHEPNFSIFISNATDSTYVRFPTASMAKVDFEVKKWTDIDFGLGKLDWLKHPNEI